MLISYGKQKKNHFQKFSGKVVRSNFRAILQKIFGPNANLKTEIVNCHSIFPVVVINFSWAIS